MSFAFAAEVTQPNGEANKGVKITDKSSPSTLHKVKVVTYQQVKINRQHNLGGAVPAAQDSQLSAQISSLINHFAVNAGDEVKKGQLLVALQCNENKLRLKQAKASLNAQNAQLKYATFQFKQANKLYKNGDISSQEYNLRHSEQSRLFAMLDASKSAQSIAKINVDRCQIKAPFEGYITKRYANVGELTHAGTLLLQLVSKFNNIVEVEVNHRLLNSFRQGKNHQFIVNNIKYPLKIEAILPILNTKTRNHFARLRFAEKVATTGSIGKVIWQDANASIPANYIVTRNHKLGVFLAENNVAKFVEVKNTLEGQSAYLSLSGDTQIISNGRFSVKDGDALQIEK